VRGRWGSRGEQVSAPSVEESARRPSPPPICHHHRSSLRLHRPRPCRCLLRRRCHHHHLDDPHQRKTSQTAHRTRPLGVRMEGSLAWECAPPIGRRRAARGPSPLCPRRPSQQQRLRRPDSRGAVQGRTSTWLDPAGLPRALNALHPAHRRGCNSRQDRLEIAKSALGRPWRRNCAQTDLFSRVPGSAGWSTVGESDHSARSNLAWPIGTAANFPI